MFLCRKIIIVAFLSFIALGFIAISHSQGAHTKSTPGIVKTNKGIQQSKNYRFFGVVGEPWHITTWDQALKIRVDLVSNYIPFGSRATPLLRAQKAKELGRALFISWLPRPEGGNPYIPSHYSMLAIAKGKQDSYIKRFALDCVESKTFILLRLAPEFLGSWEPWHGDPNNYIKAWKHIHTIFKEANATNVKFVWSPGMPIGSISDAEWQLETRQYWPGAAYVDYVDTTTVSHHGQQFSHFAKDIPLLRAYHKPVTLGEMYAPPKLRCSWLRQTVSFVNQNSWIRAIVWLDRDRQHSLSTTSCRDELRHLKH